MNILIPFEFNIRSAGSQQSTIEIIKNNNVGNKFFALLPSVGDYGIELEKYNVKVYYVGDYNYWSFSLREIRKTLLDFIKVYKSMKSIVINENIDIVHTTLYLSLTVAVLLKILNRINCKITWHFRSFELSYLKIMLIKLFKNKIDRIIATTEIGKDKLIKLGVDEKKINVIYNSTSFCNDNVNYNKQAKKDNIKVALIGRICPFKGQKEYIEIAHRILQNINKNITFSIVGNIGIDSDRLYLQEVENLIRQYNLEKYVKFEGEIYDINQYLKDIDLLFCTTNYPGESFGRVIIEAFSNKIPVISFNYGAEREVISNNIDGFLANNIDEFVEKSLILLNDEITRIEMGLNGFNKTISKFNARINNELINKLFLEI